MHFKFHAGKAEGMILCNLSFGCMTLFALAGIVGLEWQKCDIVPVEMDAMNIVKSP